MEAKALSLDGNTAAQLSRMEWVDALKGMGILFIVISHVLGSPYLFHVPLFFLLSGFLYRPAPAGYYLRHSALRLMAPYVIYMTVISLPWLRGYIEYGKEFDWLNLFVGGSCLPYECCPLWFIPVLWISLNIVNLMHRRRMCLFGVCPVSYFCAVVL